MTLFKKDQVENEILEFLKTKSALIERGGVKRETNFFEEGILDSLAFVDLVSFIEERYDILLNEGGEITTSKFGSLSQILPIVHSLLQKNNRLG